MSEKYRVEQNPSGFVYVVDPQGKKICTVFGSDQIKIERAHKIAKIFSVLPENANETQIKTA